MHALFASIPQAGHTAPLVPIARELTARGHRVRWLGGRQFADQIRSTGAEFAPLSESIDHNGRNVDEVFPARQALRGLAKLRYDLCAVFIEPIPAQLADLRRLHDEEPADLVVHDMGFGGAPSFAALGGPRAVSVGIGPMTLASPHTAPFGLGLQPGSGPVSQLRNRALQALLDRVLLREVHDRLAAVQRSLGLTPAGDGISGLSPDLHLHNGVAEFEHPRPDLPPQVHFVGALVDPTPSGEVPSWWAEVERADRPVVHVTQGTVADTDLGDLVLPTLHALADLDVLVVASVGRQTPENVPANARVAPFLPYDRLLPRLSVMVTNGGFGGVQQALSHGVPLVVAGTTEDKPEVAARVARAGVGVNLRTGKPKPAAIRAAVQRLLGTSETRSNAERMARLYQAQDAARNSAELIERFHAESSVARSAPGRPVGQDSLSPLRIQSK